MTESTQHYFYSTFLELYKKVEETKDKNPLDDPGFRRDILKNEGPSLKLLHLLKPNLIRTILKPQRVIQDEPDFYIAIDLLTNTYYICYRTLLMLDIDFYKLDIGPLAFNKNDDDKTKTKIERRDEILLNLERYTKNHPDILFRIYESRNGVHAFVINKPFDYEKDDTAKFSIDLNSDFYYTIYASLRGWSVRLNRKKNDQWPLYNYIKDIGTGIPDQHLEKLVTLHLKLCDCFKNTGCNLMHDG